MHHFERPLPSLRFLWAYLALLSLSATARTENEPRRTFDIPAADASVTLRAFAEQSAQEIVYQGETVRGAKTNAVQGEFTPRAALERMLRGTPLVVHVTRGGIVSVKRADDPNGAGTAAEKSGRPETDSRQTRGEDAVRLEAFEVFGSKSLNMDIRRTRDDAQPYVVFDREKIERSGALNLEDFLKQRLTMNTIGNTNSQSGTFSGNLSQINLRGLGTGQTLVLIDGHRVANPNILGNVGQSDLNGIPLGAVDRIEVLPTTASGIYGGGATGGVINIVLRRDYVGAELKVNYENTFDSDSARRNVALSAGFTLEGGKTSVLLAASWSDANVLAIFDRDFVQEGRRRILANNPTFFATATTPILGATPNIRSSNGSNLTLKSGTPLGSPITHVPAGYAGPAADGGAALVANAGRYNYALAAGGQQHCGGNGAMLNSPRVETAMLTVRRQFAPWLQAFVEGAASNNISRFPFSNVFGAVTLAANAPTNPFMQAILVTPTTTTSDRETYSSSFDRRLVGGVVAKLPWDWTGGFDYTWNRSRLSATQPTGLSTAGETAIGNGAVNILGDPALGPVDFGPYMGPDSYYSPPFRSTLQDATLRVSGPAGRLPAGPVVVSATLERRREAFDEATNITVATRTYPSRSQVVESAYLEARVPLVSAANRRRGLELLELQLAARQDRYAINGVTSSVAPGTGTPVERITTRKSSTNPTAGVRYQPVPDVALRASYGTGFLPPTVNQVLPGAISGLSGAIDPRRGNTSAGIVQTRGGGNPALRPEESESWSAGAILTPRVLPGARLSVDYTRILKTDNISTISAQQLVDNEALFPTRVVRGPVPAGDPYGVGPIQFLDTSIANFAQARVEAYDVQADLRLKGVAGGVADLVAIATWQTHSQTKFLPSSPIVENVGIASNFPLKFKANASLVWRRDAWTLGWDTRYFHSYVISTNAVVILNQGARRVPRQIYHDAFVGYRFEQTARSGGGERSVAAKLLRGAEAQVGVKNVFNTSPPFDAAVTGSRYYSPFGDPRLAAYYAQLKRGF